MEKDRVVAIDGPSGCGKSTVARLIAERLSYLFIDTGAMFRAIAVYQWTNNLSEIDLVKHLQIIKMEYHGFNDRLISINSKDLTDQIRKPEIAQIASTISQIKEVRTFLLNFQRSLVKNSFAVMEGRDIGTVVFPNSFCKFFLTANENERAMRRMKELNEKGIQIELSEILSDQKKRDLQDSVRSLAPLKKAEDAIEIDTSGISIEKVVKKMVAIVRERGI